MQKELREAFRLYDKQGQLCKNATERFNCNYEINKKKRENSKHGLYYFLIGNGYIPTTCLKEILRELDDQLTNAELDIMIEEIDSDGSGTVDFDGEFSFN